MRSPCRPPVIGVRSAAQGFRPVPGIPAPAGLVFSAITGTSALIASMSLVRR